MPDLKSSQDVGYSVSGEEGKQCQNCKYYQMINGYEGNCFGHKVLASGSCNQFLVK
ncbi:MAG: hypothetical protein ABIG60_00585 [Patescibacteria group bacterium]